MGDIRIEIEIPLLLSFFYLFSKAANRHIRAVILGLRESISVDSRSALKTLSGGEFDWGGTSVKR